MHPVDPHSKNMKLLKPMLLAFVLLHCSSWAATISIVIDSGGKSFRDELGGTLSGGNPSINGDGAKVQLGYYSDASLPSTPFGATGSDAISSFTALTGPGTPFGVNFTIGDSVSNSAGDGELFVDSFSISTGIADGILPTAGKPLVLRIFNGAQTFALDLSNANGLWNWQTPADVPPTVFIYLDDPGLVARGTGLNNRSSVSVGASPQTLNSVVPEPTSAALVMVGLLSFAARRRRQAN